VLHAVGHEPATVPHMMKPATPLDVIGILENLPHLQPSDIQGVKWDLQRKHNSENEWQGQQLDSIRWEGQRQMTQSISRPVTLVTVSDNSESSDMTRMGGPHTLHE
jgi:hypothetical protein